MKTPMNEQAQLESYPRWNIKPVQYGANLVFDTAGAREAAESNELQPAGREITG